MVGQFVSLNRQNHHIALMKKTVLCLSLALVISEVSAASFDLNEEWKLETKTVLSFGTNWSTQEASSSLVYKPDANHIGKEGHSIDINGDDGRVNFNEGDVISQVVKGFTELNLKGKQQGAVVSAKYWYDHAYETGEGDFKAFDDSAWPRLAKFKGIDLWDAYVWKNFALDNGQSANMKLGANIPCSGANHSSSKMDSIVSVLLIMLQ